MGACLSLSSWESISMQDANYLYSTYFMIDDLHQYLGLHSDGRLPHIESVGSYFISEVQKVKQLYQSNERLKEYNSDACFPILHMLTKKLLQSNSTMYFTVFILILAIIILYCHLL